MLLSKHLALENHLVQILSSKPGCTVSDIIKFLETKKESYSQRGVYKELKKLEDQEIVFKLKTKYYLRFSWVISVLSFADNLYDTYTAPDHLAKILTISSGKITHKFTNLRKLDLYWMQLMISLYQIYPMHPMFLWCPYHWFHLVHDYSVQQFYSAVEIEGGKRYHIVGNDSYIERQAVKGLPKETQYSFSESPFRDEIYSYYTVIGEHVITVKLDKVITEKIHNLFSSITKSSQMDNKKISEVFSSKVKSSLSIELNKKKASKLKRQFSEFFGVNPDKLS